MARVMLATTDDALRAYLARKLKRCGHSVTRVAEFSSALTILEEAEYDLLLTSIDAAKPDEVDFARTAQEIDPDMRIVFITGFAAVAVKRPDESRLSDPLLDKPLHLMRLPQEVERLVAA